VRCNPVQLVLKLVLSRIAYVVDLYDVLGSIGFCPSGTDRLSDVDFHIFLMYVSCIA
jgi:hypothetical protein